VSDLHSAISAGHYAQKQIFSRDKLVAWSHSRRFRTGLALAREFRGKRVLDFGSGDGTFLALAMMSDDAPALGAGAELTHEVVDDCRRRYREEPRLHFLQVNELDTPGHTRTYDAVFCMEVLEHVVDWEPVMAQMTRLLAPGGKLIVSVPVETGLPVLVKQTVRCIAGWRKVGHYPGTTSYSWPELLSALMAGSRQHLVRPVFETGSGPAHDHKGFNWMVLRDRLSREFELERVMASPFTWLGPRLATQVWFICRVRQS
jgi:SAM-dependent methyltransferase